MELTQYFTRMTMRWAVDIVCVLNFWLLLGSRSIFQLSEAYFSLEFLVTHSPLYVYLKWKPFKDDHTSLTDDIQEKEDFQEKEKEEDFQGCAFESEK